MIIKMCVLFLLSRVCNNCWVYWVRLIIKYIDSVFGWVGFWVGLGRIWVGLGRIWVKNKWSV